MVLTRRCVRNDDRTFSNTVPCQQPNMASNVVILHNNRRHVIKTTPGMLCRDILTQACEKIGFKNIENYGLKYPSPHLIINSRNGKSTVDLSLPVRLANLAPGAKLEIYKISASEGICL